MIAARIRIETGPEIEDDDARHLAQHNELLTKLQHLDRAEVGDTFKVEVEYPAERADETVGWDVSGDAISVDYTKLDEDGNPTIATLPPYSEEAP